MFITDQDYEVVIGRQAMQAVSRCSETLRANAEAEACEEIAGYLRPDYDTEAVFAAEGPDRNPRLVMAAVDMALYHLSASMPQQMGSAVRKERYDNAIKWLEGIRAGKIVPDLPAAAGPDGEEPEGAGTVWSCAHKLRHEW